MRDMLLVLTMDGDYAYDIARKLRREGIYCRLAPRETTAEQVQAVNPSGLILAGASDGRAYGTTMDMRLLTMGLPVLAMGDSATEIAVYLGARRGEIQDVNEALHVTYGENPLFEGVEPSDRWFESPDRWELGGDLNPVAWASWENQAPVGFTDASGRVYGLQFQVERNDPEGMAILMNFAIRVCACTAWRTPEVIEKQCQREMQALPEHQKLLCLVSGGLDSAVCARLSAMAVGDRAQCVLIDTGLMRAGEIAEVRQIYRDGMRMDTNFVDAQDRTFAALSGVLSSADKTRVASEIYEETVRDFARELPDVVALVQGTNYTDLLARGIYEEEELPDCGPLRVIEPLRDLFKDEVRDLGVRLALPEEMLRRQSFPGAGLALRLTGPVTPERIALLRAADAILREEIGRAGQDKRLSVYFVVLSAMPQGQEPGEMAILRALHNSEAGVFAARLPYDILERIVERILGEVPGVQRVVYDLTAGDTAKIEWV